MFLSDILNIAKALKFKYHSRAFRKLLYGDRNRLCGLGLTLVKTKMMSNGRSFILPPGVMLNDAQKRPQGRGKTSKIFDFLSNTFKKGFWV